MSKFSFSHTQDDLKVIYEFEAIHISKIVENFESFLRGCDFVFDSLEIVSDSSRSDTDNLSNIDTFSFYDPDSAFREAPTQPTMSDCSNVNVCPGAAGVPDTISLGDWSTQCKNFDTITISGSNGKEIYHSR
jgi:hypothetical protein